MNATTQFNVNETVFVYDGGRLAERTVEAIKIIITSEFTKISYQLKNGFGSVDETEVFKSKYEFIEYMQC